MRLLALSSGRANNLNLLRFAAATAVLFSHSFVLSTGLPGAEPLRQQIGMTMGTIAVDVFFLASGFLVMASMARSASVVDFAVARALRIFPALLVMLLLTVFGLGPALTRMPWADYLHAGQTYSYLAHGATLVMGVEFMLPGLFEANPYRGAVNGSLWTLPTEVKMYAILALAWAVLALPALKNAAARRHLRLPAMAAACLTFMVVAGVALVRQFLSHAPESSFLWLFFMFFSGASCFWLRSRIELSALAAGALVAALVVAGLWFRSAFTLLYLGSIPYITFYLAYGPSGPIRQYNRVGDFSYGIYIYAFPVQQAVVALVPGISPWSLFLWSGLATLALAMASWSAVEERALRLKVPVVGYLRRHFAALR